MDRQEPAYYSIIPAPVRYDKRLTPNAKLLFGEITSLTNQLGFCYASNKYFERLYKVSKQSINFWLKQLETYGYIKRHIYRDKSSKEILNRYITIFDKPIKENFNRPIQEIFKENNKYINNKSNNSLNKKRKNPISRGQSLK